MKLVKVAGAELNQTPLGWENNFDNMVAAIEDARSQGVGILCLPELCITGYTCEDFFLSPGLLQTALDQLVKLLPHTKGIVTCFGLPMMFHNRVFNCEAVVADGELLGFVAKKYLAGDGIHYEPRWFTPWPNLLCHNIDLCDYHPEIADQLKQTVYPIGEIFFSIGGVKIGFEICEDAWVPNRPGRTLFNYGIDLIMNPSASHFAFDKLNTRKSLVLDGSRSFGTAYIYTNLIGNEAGRAVYDGGTLIAANGTLLALGERLHFENYQLATAVIDFEDIRQKQSQSSMEFREAAGSNQLIRASFNFPKAKPEPLKDQDAPWEDSAFIKEEEFARSVALGLFDYMRKSRSKGFVVSLSGGADSAAVACSIYTMVALAIEDLGLKKFKEKLGYFTEIQNCSSIEDIMPHMLVAAYQPTANSGEVTRTAATELAKALHAQFYLLDVTEVHKNYVEMINGALGRELSWETDDIALQNIQARVRSPSIWMLANIRNALLLSTSNRSEAAVGYATMDGDTSGGLSPLAGIDKNFLRQWLRWLEREGLSGSLSVPALSYINTQQPTAELRPVEQEQTDEGDLMPYDFLDSAEEAAIRDKKMPLETYQLMRARHPEYSVEQTHLWVERFYKLWARNQWKRERYAPSFHLDDANLDPKTWCRFPILSGGFEYELRQLRKYVEENEDSEAG